ncbi:MAG: amidohydrolase, partial [Bacteroidia bacterium]
MSKTDFSHPSEKAERILAADILMVNGLVVTMDEQYRIFEDGALAIDGGKIVAVGETEEVKTRCTGRRVVDARRKLIMPGLINAHTHAPMNIFRGFADDLTLNEWLYDYIFPLESAFVNPQNVELGTRLAIAEMIRSGTTTFNDMYYYSDVMAKVVDD